jgi:hypothetical protein
MGTPWSLPAQAPVAGRALHSSALPRFTLRQIVIQRNDSGARIPGPWLRAAAAALPESLTMVAYTAAASRSGITPLQGSALTSDRSRHVMGLYRRAELTGAARRTLESIRASIPSDTTRARFDRLFRPRGEWILDLHDAALEWARPRISGTGWHSARRALGAAHWIPADLSTSPSEAMAGALYGLTVLAATDSAAFQAARANLWRSDSTSAIAVLTLLTGYTEAQRWYTDALSFFLTEPWVPDAGGRSLRDYVQDEWHGSSRSPADSGVVVPEIVPRLFGYPQAVPYYGVPTALFRRLVKSENASAVDWLGRFGESGLLRALRWLPQGDSTLMLRTGSETVRLTTVPRQSRENLNGFLEPRDAIAIDPGYMPLLALGAVVHEWQHLLFRRRQLQAFAERTGHPGSSTVELPGTQPYVAEGFAEWSAERILAPVVARWPLLSLSELEKRAGLARTGGDEQHAMGYALVRVMAAELRDAAVTTGLLLRHAERPSAILNEPVLRRAWSKYRRAPDRVVTTAAHRMLIPEVTFTIEDGFPDVIATRILVPLDGPGNR